MSRRRVGGAIKKGRGAKIALREEEVEEEVDEDVEDTKKAKEPVKTKPIAKKGGKAAVNKNKYCLTSKMKTPQGISRNFVRNLSLQPANNVPTEMLIEFVFARPAGTMTISL